MKLTSFQYNWLHALYNDDDDAKSSYLDIAEQKLVYKIITTFSYNNKDRGILNEIIRYYKSMIVLNDPAGTPHWPYVKTKKIAV